MNQKEMIEEQIVVKEKVVEDILDEGCRYLLGFRQPLHKPEAGKRTLHNLGLIVVVEGESGTGLFRFFSLFNHFEHDWAHRIEKVALKAISDDLLPEAPFNTAEDEKSAKADLKEYFKIEEELDSTVWEWARALIRKLTSPKPCLGAGWTQRRSFF